MKDMTVKSLFSKTYMFQTFKRALTKHKLNMRDLHLPASTGLHRKRLFKIINLFFNSIRLKLSIAIVSDQTQTIYRYQAEIIYRYSIYRYFIFRNFIILELCNTEERRVALHQYLTKSVLKNVFEFSDNILYIPNLAEILL